MTHIADLLLEETIRSLVPVLVAELLRRLRKQPLSPTPTERTARPDQR